MTRWRNKYKKDQYDHILRKIEYFNDKPFDTLQSVKEEKQADIGKKVNKDPKESSKDWIT